jgi:hypothetical protein
MRAAAVVLVLLGLALPGPAWAQDTGDPLGPLPQAAPTATPTPVAIQDAEDDEDIGRGTLLVIGGGLLAVFLVIGRAIFRDARRHVPAEAHPGALREQGPHRHAKQAKAHARKKTKAQRAARRRNR